MTKIYDMDDNLLKIGCNLYEGIRTEYTGQADDGGEVTVGVYNKELEKGDLVKLKDHSTAGLIQVEICAAGDDIAHGILLDDPIGEDTVTASAATPDAAYQRTGTVGFFAQAIKPFTVSATGTISPGDILGLDANEENELEVEHDYANIVATPSIVTQPHAFTSATYAAAGNKVSVFIGMNPVITN